MRRLLVLGSVAVVVGALLVPATTATAVTSVTAVTAVNPWTHQLIAPAFTPTAVAVDASGHLYVSDSPGKRVVKLDAATGAVAAGFDTSAANLSNPQGVAVDASGHVYVADYGFPKGRVLELNGTTGAVIPGFSPSVSFRAPYGVAVDGANRVYVTDLDSAVLALDASTGAALAGFDTTPTGVSTPRAVTVDGAGHVYVTDDNSSQVVKLDAVTGAPVAGFAAKSPALCAPSALSHDGANNLYATGQCNSQVKRLNATTGAVLSTFDPKSSGLSFPNAVAADAAGHVYLTDNTSGLVAVFVGSTGVRVAGFDPSSAGLHKPRVVSSDGSGHVYVTDGNGSSIVKLDTTTGAAIPAFNTSSAGLKLVNGVAADTTGHVFVSDAGLKRVVKLDGSTGAVIAAFSTAATALNRPMGIDVDDAGHVFVADWGLKRVVKFDATTGAVISAFRATAAALELPVDVAADGVGHVYVSSAEAASDYGRVLKLDATTGTVVRGFAHEQQGGFGGITAGGGRVYTSSGVELDPLTGGLIVSQSAPVGTDVDTDGAGHVMVANPDVGVSRYTPGAPTAPGPPASVRGYARDSSVIVTWRQLESGGALVTRSTVTATPGGRTCTATTGQATCTVTGLRNGTRYTFRVTATNRLGTSSPSAPTGVVALLAPPRWVSGPTVTGRPLVGRTLTCTATYVRATTYRYQWRRDGKNLGAGTAGPRPTTTHKVTPADYKHLLSCAASASNASGRTTVRTSRAVRVRQGAPLTVVIRPTFSGTVLVGRLLTGRHGEWSPAARSYRYQWLRDGRRISVGAGKTYRVRSSDRGHLISVRVTAHLYGYADGRRSSSAVRVPST